tara:strand:+ start:6230 stop:9046 length:2817 start_codon:yes stop_codon:yes gene_type:complete
MATFEAQVEGQTGLSIDGSSSPTQTELTQFLKDGVIDVTSRCLSINPREANNFSRESAEQTSNGINVGSSKILSVVREDGNDGQWYPCRKENIGLQYKVTDTSSLHYASKFNPVYMITQNRNVHVYPAPSTSGNDTFKVLYVNYDPEESDGTDLQYDSTGIKWFPDDKVYLVVLYASIKSLENSLSAKSLPDAITIPVLPSSVSLSSVSTSLPSFTEPSAFVPPASLADANVSFSEVGDFPAYVSPSFSAPTLGSVGSLTLPSVPVAPSLTSNSVSFSTTAPSYNEPVLSLTTFPTITWSFPSVPVAPSISAQTVADFSSSAPTYTQPVLSLADAPTISNLSISVSAPTVPVLSSSSVSFSSSAPTYTQPVLSLGSAPTISDLSISAAQPVAPSLASNSVSFSTTAPVYTAPVASADFSTVDTFISTDEDTELASAKIQEISAQIGKYQADIQNQLNNFNDANIEYQAQLQKAMKDADLSQADDSQSIQKYQAELQVYQNNINKEVQEYQQNLEGDLRVWQTERQTDLQKYASDIQNNLNSFNQSNVEYQADLQVAIQNAQLSQSDDGQILQKYSNEVQSYQSQVSKEVQEYQQNLEGDLKVWQVERQTDIQKYSADIQNAVNSFNKENVIYQATVQEKIQEAQLADSNEAKKLQKYQQEISSYGAEVNKVVNGNKSQIDEWQSRNAAEIQKYGSDIQNRLNTFNKENVEYQAQLQISIQNAQLSQADDGQKLQKYSSEVGLYQAEVNSKIQEWVNEEWNQNFLKYQNDYASLLKEYGTDIQSESERVKNDVQNYQQKVAKALQTYQAETGYDVAKLNADIQKESQRFTQDLAKQTTSYKSDLEKYQSEAGKINQDNQSKIAKFSAEVQSFSAELANKVQEFTSRLQKSVTDYGWMESRMANLKEQYNTAFTIMAGAVQQQQPTAPPEQQGQQQQYRR